MDITDEILFDFFKQMPKLELHAHLNGSLSPNTLQKLIELRKKNSRGESDLQVPNLSSNDDLSECFKTFSLVHSIIDSPEAIYMGACDVIEEFYNDGVHYLELRTTPKEVGPAMTQEVYVQAVIKAIEDTCSRKCEGMFVKLLLSIDRERSFEMAEDTLKIAKKYYARSSHVVGIDLSGDPTKGEIGPFIPIMEYAQKIGLKLAVHMAEIPNKLNEVEQLLNLTPNRLGHGTFLHPAKKGCQKIFDLLKNLKIPLEMCLTSNVVSKTVPSYEEHHFPLFKEINYPCVLCTDDKGLFDTTLSKEYYLASQYYSLTKDDLFNMSYQSINYAFADNSTKHKLKELWRTKKVGLIYGLIGPNAVV